MPQPATAARQMPAELLEHLEHLGVQTLTRSDDEVLAVPQALAGLFPGGGLRRGSTVTVSTSPSLVLALLAEISKRPGWCAEVGSPLLGSAAAAEVGVVLERFVRVADPGEQWPSVVASLLEAFEVVVVHPPARVSGSDMRRLSARARERSSVLIVTGAWDGAVLGLRVTDQRWHGLGAGHGYLRAREIEVQALGHGAAAVPRRARLWLPGVDGGITPARSSAA